VPTHARHPHIHDGNAVLAGIFRFQVYLGGFPHCPLNARGAAHREGGLCDSLHGKKHFCSLHLFDVVELASGIGIFTDRSTDRDKDVSTGVRLAEVTGAAGCFCLGPHLGIVVRRDEDDRSEVLDF